MWATESKQNRSHRCLAGAIIIANAVTLVLAATILITKLVIEWQARDPRKP